MSVSWCFCVKFVAMHDFLVLSRAHSYASHTHRGLRPMHDLLNLSRAPFFATSWLIIADCVLYFQKSSHIFEQARMCLLPENARLKSIAQKESPLTDDDSSSAKGRNSLRVTTFIPRQLTLPGSAGYYHIPVR